MYQFRQIHVTIHSYINFDKYILHFREKHLTTLTNPIETKFKKSTDWLSDKARQWSELDPIKNIAVISIIISLPARLVNFIHLKPSPPPQPHVLCKHCCMVDQMYLLPQVHLRLFEMSWPVKSKGQRLFSCFIKSQKNCELKIETSGRLGSDSTASYVQGRNSAWQPSAQTVFGAAASRISYQPKDLIWRILWLMYLKCAHLETRGLNHYDWKEWVQLFNFDTLYQKIFADVKPVMTNQAKLVYIIHIYRVVFFYWSALKMT